MPFFRKISDKRNKKQATLQVRVPNAKKIFPVKRALSSALFHKERASLTVEAALALPLFLFSMVILMMPMKLMDDGRRIQTALEGAGEAVSQYAYIMCRLEEGEAEKGYEVPEIIGEMGGILKKEGVLLYVKSRLEKQVDFDRFQTVTFMRSSVLADGETIDLIMDYRIKLPFSVFGLDHIPMTARSRRRAWIGRKGGTGNKDGAGETDELVYVGKSSTRYHKSRTCHYLYNDIRPVSLEQAEGMRSLAGKRYGPCSRCGKYAKKGGTVYIMPGGGHYHSDRNCLAIAAYARAVPLSEAKHLGACSYCSQ